MIINPAISLRTLGAIYINKKVPIGAAMRLANISNDIYFISICRHVCTRRIVLVKKLKITTKGTASVRGMTFTRIGIEIRANPKLVKP